MYVYTYIYIPTSLYIDMLLFMNKCAHALILVLYCLGTRRKLPTIHESTSIYPCVCICRSTHRYIHIYVHAYIPGLTRAPGLTPDK